MEKVNGVDTISDNIILEPPEEIKLSFDTMKKAQRLQDLLLPRWAAFVPYCAKCKVPLIWILGDERMLFECPSCAVVWVKDSNWNENLGKALGKSKEKNGVRSKVSKDG